MSNWALFCLFVWGGGLDMDQLQRYLISHYQSIHNLSAGKPDTLGWAHKLLIGKLLWAGCQKCEHIPLALPKYRPSVRRGLDLRKQSEILVGVWGFCQMCSNLTSINTVYLQTITLKSGIFRCVRLRLLSPPAAQAHWSGRRAEKGGLYFCTPPSQLIDDQAQKQELESTCQASFWELCERK